MAEILCSFLKFDILYFEVEVTFALLKL